jgi:TRAP-type C4-dicarboxylate transport system permease large subunit
MLNNAILSIPKHLAIAALIILIIFLGMFLETVSIASIAGPLTDYIVRNLGLDPIWWGNIFCFTLMTAFLTPPVGMGVYLFKGVVRDAPISRIFRASTPFLIIELLLVVVFTVFPQVITVPLELLAK